MLTLASRSDETGISLGVQVWGPIPMSSCLLWNSLFIKYPSPGSKFPQLPLKKKTLTMTKFYGAQKATQQARGTVMMC